MEPLLGLAAAGSSLSETPYCGWGDVESHFLCLEQVVWIQAASSKWNIFISANVAAASSAEGEILCLDFKRSIPSFPQIICRRKYALYRSSSLNLNSVLQTNFEGLPCNCQAVRGSSLELHQVIDPPVKVGQLRWRYWGSDPLARSSFPPLL